MSKSRADSGSSAAAQPAAQQNPQRSRRRTLWPILGALGVLSTAGAYVVTLALDAARDTITDPLSVEVRDRIQSPNFLFPPGVVPAEAPIPDGLPGEEFLAWATSGGIPYHDRALEIVFRGRDVEPVIIQEVQVRVLGREPIAPGSWVNAWDGCGGLQPVRILEVDLAEDPPAVQLLIDGAPSDGTVLRVSNSEVEVVDVDVQAGAGVVAWVFDVLYSSAGEQGTFTVRDDGEPFRIAGGGDPLVFSLAADPRTLTRDDGYRERLRSGEPLC